MMMTRHTHTNLTHTHGRARSLLLFSVFFTRGVRVKGSHSQVRVPTRRRSTRNRNYLGFFFSLLIGLLQRTEFSLFISLLLLLLLVARRRLRSRSNANHGRRSFGRHLGSKGTSLCCSTRGPHTTTTDLPTVLPDRVGN